MMDSAEKLELERLLQNPAAPGYRFSRDYYEKYNATDPNKEQLIAEGERKLAELRNIHTDWFKELIHNTVSVSKAETIRLPNIVQVSTPTKEGDWKAITSSVST